MNVVKRNPRSFFTDEFFKDWAGGSQLAQRLNAPVNIRETDAAFNIELIAPGLKKEDFNIEVDNSVLTISAGAKAAAEEEVQGKFTRREFVFQAFKRSFTLPETVNEDEINAAYADGVLSVYIPKKEEAQPKAKKQIGIS